MKNPLKIEDATNIKIMNNNEMNNLISFTYLPSGNDTLQIPQELIYPIEIDQYLTEMLD